MTCTKTIGIKTVFSFGFLICLVLLFSSCGVKYYDIVKTETPQSPNQPSVREVAMRYVKSQTVYNQFETLAVFDALWLSDEVRKAYVDVYCNKHGLTQEGAKDSMLKRNLEENNHWITFYVLADIRDRTHPTLSDKDSAWSLYATHGDISVEPESIKEVELECEYQLFFGRGRFVPAKAAYIVKFPATEFLKNQSPVTDVTLVVGSVHKKIQFAWDKECLRKSNQKVLSDEDFYWG